MPGIPMLGTPDANSFWISFWAALYSGALYSVVTGIFVGLSVWWVQRRTDHRRYIKECERELALLREKLRSAADQPDFLNIKSVVDSAPAPVVAIIMVLTASPLDLWLENLKKHKKFLLVLKDLQRAYSNFVRVSGKLSFELSVFIRAHNASYNQITRLDFEDCSYFIGRTHNVPGEKMVTCIASCTLDELPRLEATFQAAKNHDAIKNLVNPYLEARAYLVTRFDLVKKALD